MEIMVYGGESRDEGKILTEGSGNMHILSRGRDSWTLWAKGPPGTSYAFSITLDQKDLDTLHWQFVWDEYQSPRKPRGPGG